MSAVGESSAALALRVPTNDPVISGYRDQARRIHEAAAALVVDSEFAKQEATTFLVSISQLKHNAEAKRVALVKEPNSFVTAVNALFRDVLAPVVAADQVLRAKQLQYDREQKAAAAAAAAAAERQRLEAAALVEEAVKAEMEGKPAVAEQLVETAIAREAAASLASIQAAATPPKTTRGATGGSATTKLVWTFKVTNFDRVPRAYLLLNEEEVRDAIRNGAREDDIPGLEIYQNTQLSVRA